MQPYERVRGSQPEVLSLRETADLLRVGFHHVVHGVVLGHLPVVWQGPRPAVDRRALLCQLNPYRHDMDRGDLHDS